MMIDMIVIASSMKTDITRPKKVLKMFIAKVCDG